MSNLNITKEARAQQEKINYFNSKVGNKNEDQAIIYLIEADWDERRAVQIYMNRNKKQPPSQNKYNQPSKNSNLSEFHVKDTLLGQNATYQNKDSVNFKNFVKYLNSQFQLTANSFENFIKLLKDHAGIAIILTSDKFDAVKRQIQKIKNNSLCSDIITNTILFIIMKDSSLGKEFINKFPCTRFPFYIFCKYKNNKSIYVTGHNEGLINMNALIDNVLNAIPDTKANVRSSLKCSLNASININKNKNKVNNNNDIKEDNFDENMWNYNDFCLGTSMELNKLIEQLGISDNNNNNNNQNINSNNPNPVSNNANNNNNINIKDSIAGLSAGEIYAKREREMRELERQQEEKMKKEEEEKQKILDEKNRQKKVIEDYEKDAERCKKLLTKEPDENDVNACHVIFRYPDGDKINERRFFKNEKIEILFHYIKSLGREIYFENESTDFDLIYGFPPKKLEKTKTKTLEEEGLCPRCIIQIREK